MSTAPKQTTPLDASAQSGSTSADGANRWCLDTPLTVYTVDSLRGQALERMAKPEMLTFDLGNVQECDCAGLQFLCSARKTAALVGKPLRIERPSPAILTAAEAIGLNPKEFLESTSQK